MNMIGQLRQRVIRDGTASLNVDEFNQLQAEWITRAKIEVVPPVEKTMPDHAEELAKALRHLLHNAKASGAEMGLAIDVAEDALTNYREATIDD